MNLPALGPDQLLVRRLRLCAPAGAGGGEAAALRARLARTDWPRAGGSAWVLVRRLAVHGERGAVAGLAAARLAEQVREAVDAGSPAAECAGAVRFPDLDDLLARLAADLAAGRAAGLWYWRQWPELLRLAVPEALAAVLGAHPERLAALSVRLAGQGALAAVWRALTPAGALDLQGRLAARLGTVLPPAAATAGDDPADRPADLPPPPGRLRARWEAVLAGLGRRDPRRRLAACLIALEWRPLWIGAAASESVLDALGLALGGLPAVPAWDRRPRTAGAGQGGALPVAADARPDPRRGWDGGPVVGTASLHPFVPGLGTPPVASAVPLGAGRLHPSATAAADPGNRTMPREGARLARPGPPPPPANDAASPSATSRPGHPARRVSGWNNRGGGSPTNAERAGEQPQAPVWTGPSTGAPAPSEIGIPAADPVQAPPDPPPGPDYDLETGEGGLFYLVNFIARPEAQALLRAGLEPGARTGGADGWWWLWDQGRRLGLAAEGTLGRFLAERLGLAGPTELAALPDLPAGADLAALAVRLYGTEEVWRPELLQVPARLRLTPSHLDLDYPLTSVRLPVRLAALDLDPGWVPWLGRVLSFR